jgi:hypothetical protein
MSSDRDAKAVRIIEVGALNRARLAVRHDDGPADQLFLGSMQFPEDVEGSLFASHERENSEFAPKLHILTLNQSSGTLRHRL